MKVIPVSQIAGTSSRTLVGHIPEMILYKDWCKQRCVPQSRHVAQTMRETLLNRWANREVNSILVQDIYIATLPHMLSGMRCALSTELTILIESHFDLLLEAQCGTNSFWFQWFQSGYTNEELLTSPWETICVEIVALSLFSLWVCDYTLILHGGILSFNIPIQ